MVEKSSSLDQRLKVIFMETIRFSRLSEVRFFPPHLFTGDVLILSFFQRTLPDIHPLQR